VAVGNAVYERDTGGVVLWTYNTEVAVVTVVTVKFGDSRITGCVRTVKESVDLTGNVPFVELGVLVG
jgi:hypothetical protein